MVFLILGSFLVDGYVATSQRDDLGLCSKCGGLGVVSADKKNPLQSASNCSACGGSGKA